MKLFSVCLQQVVRGREEGGRFQSEFPSLDEQEMIGKREQEEKRGKEDSREHSPARQKAWGEVRPPPLPPYPPHPPHPYGPYMMPPSMRHGGEFINTTSPLFYLSHTAPLYGGGPLPGGRGYPPHPHQMAGYNRPPFPPYPQSNPFDM